MVQVGTPSPYHLAELIRFNRHKPGGKVLVFIGTHPYLLGHKHLGSRLHALDIRHSLKGRLLIDDHGIRARAAGGCTLAPVQAGVAFNHHRIAGPFKLHHHISPNSVMDPVLDILIDGPG